MMRAFRNSLGRRTRAGLASTLITLSGAATVGWAAEATPPTEPMSVWFVSPARTFHESCPLGNGRLGAMDFGGVGTEPVRNLVQEYGATYVMVTGLLNWLCCFDIFDRATGRWVWRLPVDEQGALAPKDDPETK